jgi:hypothetical protein
MFKIVCFIILYTDSDSLFHLELAQILQGHLAGMFFSFPAWYAHDMVIC